MILEYVKAWTQRIPGAHEAFKWVTSRQGEGRVYSIDSGPMRGLRWRRDNRFPYWYHTGRYEPHISAFIAAHLKPGETYWDLGAHAGYHTLQGARAVGPTGQVLAVEPHPGVCQSMREQLALNELTNVTVLEAAVSDSVGALRLVVRESDTRGNALDSIHNAAIENSSGIRIDVSGTTLDALAAQCPAPDLLKMDIEGAEATALPAGGRIWEGEHRPRCILLAYHGRDTGTVCRKFLLEQGYGLEQAEGFVTDASTTYGTFVAFDRAARAREPVRHRASDDGWRQRVGQVSNAVAALTAAAQPELVLLPLFA